MTLLTRQEMEQKLGQLFPPKQATGLTELLDNFRELEVQRAADTRELKQGLTALTAETKKLAEAQRQTTERLTEFGQRVDERFASLAAAQQQTDKGLTRLDQAMEMLTQAQQRTEGQLAELGKAITELSKSQLRTEDRLGNVSKMVTSLGNTIGFSLEEFVAALLPPYLERHWNISGLTLERRYFDLGGGRLIPYSRINRERA